MGILGIIFGFGVLLYGVWKRYNLILVTVVVSAIIGLTNGLGVIKAWQGPYVEGFAGFAAPFFLIFCFGALFGKLMEDSGAMQRIGISILGVFGEKYAIFAYMLVTALMTYGGVNGFVVIFVLLPFARVLFAKGKIPWYLFPAATYTAMYPAVGMLPGSLQTQNIIPTKYLGTTLMAAPLLGIIISVLYYAVAVLYIWYSVNAGRKNPDALDFSVPVKESDHAVGKTEDLPGFGMSILPILVALISINLLKIQIVYGMILACLTCLALFWKRYEDKLDTLNAGISNGVMPTILVSVVIGVARVVAATPTFATFKEWLVSIPINGLMKLFVVTNSVAFITGSGSGAESTCLELFSKYFLELGIHPEVIHKMAIISASGFDTMPWNSLVVLFLTMAGLNYKSSYKHIFVTCVLMTVAIGLITVFLAGLMY